MRYVENGRTAGVASEAGGTFVMGFPFESIESDVQRDRLMRDVLDFLLKQRIDDLCIYLKIVILCHSNNRFRKGSWRP